MADSRPPGGMPSQSRLADRDPVPQPRAAAARGRPVDVERGLHLGRTNSACAISPKNQNRFVFEAVAYQGTADAVSSSRQVVPMQPAPERPCTWDIGEVMIHSNSVTRAVHRPRREAEAAPERGRDLPNDAPPAKARRAGKSLAKGADDKLKAFDSLSLAGGMMRGRFSGSRRRGRRAPEEMNPLCELRLMRHALAFLLVLEKPWHFITEFLKSKQNDKRRRPKESLP